MKGRRQVGKKNMFTSPNEVAIYPSWRNKQTLLFLLLVILFFRSLSTHGLFHCTTPVFT